MTPTEKPVEVWYDGDCPLCIAARNWCTRRDRNRCLDFRDFRSTSESELPLPAESLETTLWAVAPDGALLEGFDSWRRILLEIPGWRLLARLASVPPIPLFGRPLYAFVARNRHRLPFFRRIPDGCDTDGCRR